MTEQPELRCPRCGEDVHAGQEYCLECGGRLGAPHGAGVVASRSGWGREWLLAALLALLVALVGTGAAIAISGDGDGPTAIATATGGSLTVTDAAATLTAPEPTTPSATTARTTTPTTTRPANPAAITWPRDRRAWTIVLLSLPQANGRDAAGAQAVKARERGLRRVGVLDSSRYASLHPGYYVVFQGVYESEAEAVTALQRARAVFPNAYQREIVP